MRWVGVIGTFTETSMPVVNYYKDMNKVVEVSVLSPITG